MLISDNVYMLLVLFVYNLVVLVVFDMKITSPVAIEVGYILRCGCSVISMSLGGLPSCK